MTGTHDPSIDPDPDYVPQPPVNGAGYDHGDVWGRSEHAKAIVTVEAVDFTPPAPPELWTPALDTAAIFEPLPPIPYLVPGLDLCPGAPALVAGYGFSAKTISWQAAALALALGERVWDTFTARQCRVRHVDFEQGARLTRDRYQRLMSGFELPASALGDRLSLVSMPERYLDTATVDELCKLLDGFDLVIIDSLRAACPSVDENSSQVRLVLDNLNRASERTGCTVIVIHHARKPQKDGVGGAKMAIRGSGALFDACASVFVHEAEKGHPVRISHEKARVSGRPCDDFTLTIVDTEHGGVRVTGAAALSREAVADAAGVAARKAQAERLDAEVSAVLMSAGDEGFPGGADVLARHIHRGDKGVRATVNAFIAGGLVEATGSTKDKRLRWIG